jgi:hypothetical protein
MTILKEPLVYFLLLGAVIFGLYAALDDSPPPEAKNAIVISQDDAWRLMAEFETTWRRPPSEVELAEIIDATIREELYVREALALGLDRDDAVMLPPAACLQARSGRGPEASRTGRQRQAALGNRFSPEPIRQPQPRCA